MDTSSLRRYEVSSRRSPGRWRPEAVTMTCGWAPIGILVGLRGYSMRVTVGVAACAACLADVLSSRRSALRCIHRIQM